MTLTEFLEKLTATQGTFTWELTHGELRGQQCFGGRLYCPITAVAREPCKTHMAGTIGHDTLGLSWNDVFDIMQAADGAHNAVRPLLLAAVGLS